MAKLKLKVITKKITKGKSTFTVFRTVDKNDKWTEVRFTRNCDGKIPVENGYIVVDESKINLAKDYTEYGDCFWVSEILDFIPFTKSKDDLKQYFDVVEDELEY